MFEFLGEGLFIVSIVKKLIFYIIKEFRIYLGDVYERILNFKYLLNF